MPRKPSTVKKFAEISGNSDTSSECQLKIKRYPRNPELDPQLVWQGKDEQDSHDLEIPIAPIYLQEQIHPATLIKDIHTPIPVEELQTSLFADSNSYHLEQKIQFYQHDSWMNRMILGDSLQVMTTLAEREGLKGKVQMIYIDPPYGIKFGSNWQVSTRKREIKDGKIEDLTRQPEQVKAYRDTWEMGIHSYLSYLRDRLLVARELLTESGSVFVQISDANMHWVRCLMDEVYGHRNFISHIKFYRAGTQPSLHFLPESGDYLIWYARNKDKAKFHQLYVSDGGWVSRISVKYFEHPNGQIVDAKELNSNADASLIRVYTTNNLESSTIAPTTQFIINFQGRQFRPRRGWSTSVTGIERLRMCNRLITSGKTLRRKVYTEDFPLSIINNNWTDTLTGYGMEDKIYVVQTAAKIVQRCLLMTTDPGDLVLDPTMGSGTTAYVAEQWGRRWITIDTSRVALALARTRLMSSRYPYYFLADSKEGIQQQLELGRNPPVNIKPKNDINKGFIYVTVPHISLKSIANNDEIDTIHAKWQAQFESLLSKINQSLQQTWQDWEVPETVGDNELLKQWWILRQQRQLEIDAAIARHADTEIIYDQPYEDSNRVRVSGQFTVESLAPHRLLPTAEQPNGVIQAKEAMAFETMIIDNLRIAGVQNSIKNERLHFNRLEPYAGHWLQASGEYMEQDGVVKRVAVLIGPEHGTITVQTVKAAAKEASEGQNFHLLLICGLAFEPSLAELAKSYGTQLTILLVRINPDLTMGDELLRKTNTANLFMIVGEPDIKLTRINGKIQVELLGVDIYNPTTGVIHNHSTDEIACWFIDTDYRGDTFFVRQAYFTGGNEPFNKLQRALRADINEEAWEVLYSTKSRAFNPPRSGKIAVKVINHYGDEVLKVFEVK